MIITGTFTTEQKLQRGNNPPEGNEFFADVTIVTTVEFECDICTVLEANV